MSRGSRALGELFPALFEELSAAGANVIDGIEITRPEDLVTHLASRPLLEASVRRRVRAIENVTLLDGHDVIEPVFGRPDRVTAVRVVHRETAEERRLPADLVVSATGRSARTPALLEQRGFGRPVEQRYAVGLNYSSQYFRVPSELLSEKIVLVGPTIERPTGAG